MSIRDKPRKHARRFISSKKVDHKPWNEISNSQKERKVSTNKPNSTHFS
jgi:hypothetical protein